MGCLPVDTSHANQEEDFVSSQVFKYQVNKKPGSVKRDSPLTTTDRNRRAQKLVKRTHMSTPHGKFPIPESEPSINSKYVIEQKEMEIITDANKTHQQRRTRLSFL